MYTELYLYGKNVLGGDPKYLSEGMRFSQGPFSTQNILPLRKNAAGDPGVLTSFTM